MNIADAARLYDVRHFSAKRLLAAGVSVRTVGGRFGHANAVTTLGVYAHFMVESDREVAATVGALVAPSNVRDDAEAASEGAVRPTVSVVPGRMES